MYHRGRLQGCFPLTFLYHCHSTSSSNWTCHAVSFHSKFLYRQQIMFPKVLKGSDYGPVCSFDQSTDYTFLIWHLYSFFLCFSLSLYPLFTEPPQQQQQQQHPMLSLLSQLLSRRNCQSLRSSSSSIQCCHCHCCHSWLFPRRNCHCWSLRSSSSIQCCCRHCHQSRWRQLQQIPL